MNEELQAQIAAEDVAPDDQLSPEARKRKENRIKKRHERATKKAVVEAKKAAETYTSNKQWWEANRAKLTNEQRAAYEQRQSDVVDLALAMEDYVAGTDGTTAQDLADTINEIEADVKAHGLVNHTVIVIPRIWSKEEKDFRHRVTRKGGRTVEWMNYGYLLGLPDRLWLDWEQWLAPRQKNPTVDYGAMTICSSCNSLETSQWVSESVLKEYAAKGMRHVCYRCIDAETKSRAVASIRSTLYAARVKERGTIFDSWGRLRDQ